MESDMILSSPSAPEGGSPTRYRLTLRTAAADAHWPELGRGGLGTDRKGVALVVSGCLPPTILEAGRKDTCSPSRRTEERGFHFWRRCGLQVKQGDPQFKLCLVPFCLWSVVSGPQSSKRPPSACHHPFCLGLL